MVSSIIKSLGLGILLAAGIVGGAYLLDRQGVMRWDWLSVSMMALAIVMTFLLLIPSSSTEVGPWSPRNQLRQPAARLNQEHLTVRQRNFRWLLIAIPLIVAFFFVLYLVWGSA